LAAAKKAICALFFRNSEAWFNIVDTGISGGKHRSGEHFLYATRTFVHNVNTPVILKSKNKIPPGDNASA